MLPSPLEAAWEHHHQLHQLQGRLLGAGSSEQSIPSATASSAANASSSAAGRRLLPSPGPKKVNKRERCKVCTEHILELDMRAKGAWLSQFFEQPKKVRFFTNAQSRLASVVLDGVLGSQESSCRKEWKRKVSHIDGSLMLSRQINYFVMP